MVLMTDRGLEHDRNEDAAAAGTVAGGAGQPPHAIVAAVCDGVSTSPDAYKASRAASTAGVEAMLQALAASRDMTSVVLAGLDDATRAAAAAKTQGADDRAPACTYAAAAVVFTSAGEAQITVANVGDSRAYWLPEPPSPPQRLTVDDSLAQGLISAGVPPDAHVVQKGAHTLTRWLGGNAKSEGLHNYLSEAADVAPFCNGTDPTAAARALVDHALRSGGHDNITVVLIPIAGRGR
jgi:PPM family protein phosphatase